MNDVSRREFAAGALALNVTLALPSIATAQRARDTGAARWLFFSAEEAAWIEAAVDRLIPSEPDWMGARDADVGVYIDRQLAGPFGAGERLNLTGPFKQGLPGQGYQLEFTPAQVYRRSLGKLLSNTGGTFTSSTDVEKDNFLRQLETSNSDLDGVPSGVFFETLLANTVEGYFSDPHYGGNRDMVSWRMIGFPGAHAAYLGIYTRHGVRFEKPPVSMSKVAHPGRDDFHQHDHPSNDVLPSRGGR
jgi:gluconate 2-dehydrogenase gamma chain